MENLRELLLAIDAHNVKAVKLIARGYPHLLQFETQHGWPIIHRCIANDCADKEIVELYFRHGGDAARRTNSGVSLAFLAESKFNGKRLADLFRREGSRMSAFEEAVLIIWNEVDEDRAATKFSEMIDQYPNIIYDRGDQGYTLLHYAATSQRHLVKTLLDRGADPNAVTYTGRSVLGLFANATNSADAVCYLQLVEKGARYTPAEEIIRGVALGENDRVMRTLKGKRRLAHAWVVPHGPLLHWVAWTCSDVRVVKAILSVGINPNVPNEDGETALHRASSRPGDVEVTLAIMTALLSAGAEINARSNSGDAPIHAAAENPSEQVIKLLVERGANINSLNSEGKTALDLVYSMRFLGCQSLAHWLRSEGAVAGRGLGSKPQGGKKRV